MSLQAITWAMQTLTGSQSRKHLLLVLANYANCDGECWPSQATLAGDTEMSERSIRRALAELEFLGFITRTARKRRCGVWRSDIIRLSFRPSPSKTVAEVVKAAADAEDLLSAITPPADTVSGTSGQSGRSPADTVAAKPSIEPPREPPFLAAPPKKGRLTDFGMNDRRLAVAKSEGLSEPAAQHALKLFTAHHRGKGTEAADFDALWEGWCAEAARRAPTTAPAAPAPAPGSRYPVAIDTPEAKAWAKHLGHEIKFYGRYSVDMPTRWPPAQEAA